MAADSRRTEDREPDAPADRCPACGSPIRGIAALGPGTHVLVDCGHDADALDLVAATGEAQPVATDVGTAAVLLRSPARPGGHVTH